MKLEAITVPDLGGAAEVEVIEVSVAVGAQIAVDQALITLESDKASMEVPAPLAGTVQELRIKVGDKVKQGDTILMLAIDGAAASAAGADETAQASPAAVPPTATPPTATPPTATPPTATPPTATPPSATSASAPAPAPASPPPAAPSPAPEAFVERRAAPRADGGGGSGPEVVVTVPDLGGATSVEVIEISVRAGDRVAEGAPLLVMEGDKASMELPSPVAGVVEAVEVRVGAQITSGQRIAVLRADSGAAQAVSPGAVAAPVAAPSPAPAVPVAAAVPAPAAQPTVPTPAAPLAQGDGGSAIARVLEKESRRPGAALRESERPNVPYAGPAVRQLARELGVQLEELRGSGPKGRVLKEDVQAFVKARLAEPPRAAGGFSLPPVPAIDFAAFGPVEQLALTMTQKAIVTNMARSWLNVPHVTQLDYADVSDLEAFRESLKPEMESRGNKLTPLPFLLMACARALREHPRFNASLHADGAQLVLKKYVHIGVAVDTPQGLVVPVIRDVDRKSVWELAAEARELAAKARARKLKITDMQGACFTISSLGNIGGEGFTPIVNTPEVAILGVSKLAIRPVWDGKGFQPRKTLPLSLSYDHRVINGADAGNFLSWLVAVLGDVRRLIL